jgi:hypothetical protein
MVWAEALISATLTGGWATLRYYGYLGVSRIYVDSLKDVRMIERGLLLDSCEVRLAGPKNGWRPLWTFRPIMVVLRTKHD